MNNIEDLSNVIRSETPNEYSDIIKSKFAFFFFKRLFDILASMILLLFFCVPLLILSLLVVITSGLPVIYKQNRVGKNGKIFKVLKFRTMIRNAESLGASVTLTDDMRVTRFGKILRKSRLDEIPQLFNILLGHMSFVGPRPEVPKFVQYYSPEMLATLLIRPGLTSQASIIHRNEESHFIGDIDPDQLYIENILPLKMSLNIEYFSHLSLINDLLILLKTVFVMIGMKK